jgi:hypothetical protein
MPNSAQNSMPNNSQSDIKTPEKSKSFFRDSCSSVLRNAKQLPEPLAMIANQVLRSLRFFTDQSPIAALVPAADSVVAWRFQTPGSAL